MGPPPATVLPLVIAAAIPSGHQRYIDPLSLLGEIYLGEDPATSEQSLQQVDRPLALATDEVGRFAVDHLAVGQQPEPPCHLLGEVTVGLLHLSHRHVATDLPSDCLSLTGGLELGRRNF